MGTKTIMSESFEKAANIILRFHSASLQATSSMTGVKVYPLMDGIFITGEKARVIKNAIDNIFLKMASIFIEEDKCDHQFVIRASIAYGELAHGFDVNNEVCRDIADNDTYKNALLFGMPMIQAYMAERNAPPFGVYIHESARKVNVLQGRYYLWKGIESQKEELKTKLLSYFKWCRYFSQYLEMDTSRIAFYEELVKEYFSNRNIKSNELQTLFNHEN